MSQTASQITSLTIIYSIVYSGTDQRKHQSSASLAFVRGIHQGPANYPHKWPVTRKMFPFDDVIMFWYCQVFGHLIGTVKNIQHDFTFKTNVKLNHSRLVGTQHFHYLWGVIFNTSGELGQYHGCCCPGSLCHHGISSHGLDCIGYVQVSVSHEGGIPLPVPFQFWEMIANTNIFFTNIQEV